MQTIEIIGEVGRRGELSLNLPRGIAPGKHRMTIVIDEDIAMESNDAKKLAPAYYINGRPVFTEDQLAQMDCPFPPEAEWQEEYKEWKNGKAG
jgi:hypothetical protein